MLREIFTVTNPNCYHHILLTIKLGLLFIYILSIKFTKSGWAHKI